LLKTALFQTVPV